MSSYRREPASEGDFDARSRLERRADEVPPVSAQIPVIDDPDDQEELAADR